MKRVLSVCLVFLFFMACSNDKVNIDQERHKNVKRVGYTCTGSHVSTSSEGWTGSVLDYMSKEAFD
ncbi:MAG: hypothetical protein U9N86_06550 [Bacteroidota bacterium]|nr:hypothetical protein [Bacteroidota bacterium]